MKTERGDQADEIAQARLQHLYKVLKCEDGLEPPFHPSPPASEPRHGVRWMEVATDEWTWLMRCGYTWWDLQTFMCKWKTVYFGEYVRMSDRGFRHDEWSSLMTTMAVKLQFRLPRHSHTEHADGKLPRDLCQALEALSSLIEGYTDFKALTFEDLRLIPVFVNRPQTNLLFDWIRLNDVDGVDSKSLARLLSCTRSASLNNCTNEATGRHLQQLLAEPTSKVCQLDLGSQFRLSDTTLSQMVKTARISTLSIFRLRPTDALIDSICQNKCMQQFIASELHEDHENPASWIVKLIEGSSLRDIKLLDSALHFLGKKNGTIMRLRDAMEGKRRGYGNTALQNLYIAGVSNHKLFYKLIKPMLGMNKTRHHHIKAVRARASNDEFLAVCCNLILKKEAFLRSDPDYLFEVLLHSHRHYRRWAERG